LSTIKWWWTDIGDSERTLVNQAMDARSLSQGSFTARLEETLAKGLGVPHVVVTNSGSIALLMALMAIDIGPNDEVIVPDRTWIATAHAALVLGAKVVLADSCRDSPVLDLDDVRAKITRRTKLIIPVHLNGRACDMTGISSLAQEHELHVVEDAAQALFSRNSQGMLGTIGDMGCFSLGMTKLVSMGFGGFVTTRRRDLYEKLKLIREHGVTDRAMESSTTMGFNFRVSDLLSAVGLGQMELADAKIEHVTKIYRRYADGLANLPHVRLLPVDLDAGEVPLWTEVVCADRAALDVALRRKGIEIHPGSRSLSRAPQLKASARCPNSDFFDETVARLPCGPGQPMANVDRVIEAIAEARS